MAACRSRAQAGFTFVATLVLVAVVSFGLAVLGPLWSQHAKREREAELVRIGHVYAQAIESYRNASPGSDRQYPASLEALLLDIRFVGIRRHLRKAYVDPMTGGQPWGLVRDQTGRIIGVFSQSNDEPIRQSAQAASGQRPGRYADWKFIAKKEQS